MTAPLIEVQPDAETLATAIAGELLSRLADLQDAGGEPRVVLTGGTIADAVHHELARLTPGSEVDWSKVSIWFGDERFVAADSPDRNAGQARAAFLDAVGATRVHEMPSPAEAADVHAGAVAYGEEVRAHAGRGFDVLMLGVGPDGHVASLFPGHPALDVAGAAAVGVTDSPKPPSERISLTFETLARADVVWFLASGESKAEAVRRALAPEGGPGATVAETPARGVVGVAETTWFLDRPAASLL